MVVAEPIASRMLLYTPCFSIPLPSPFHLDRARLAVNAATEITSEL